jgi:1-aminocyclopropane-1-carboxylate deaminase
LSFETREFNWPRSYIPAGASDHPLGGLGFTNLILEIADQESNLGVFFDTLLICSVTGSSHAGCVVGAVGEGRKRKIIGIDASAKPEATRAQVLRIARNTAALLDQELEIKDEDVVLDERFHAGIYGIPDEETIAAIKCRSFPLLYRGRSEGKLGWVDVVAASTDSMITDPVYEGKSMAGMIQLIKEGTIKEGSNVLYIHLGGQPALNAYSSYFPHD